MYAIVIPQLSRMLENINGLLKKAASHAETKKFDVSILLHARLAPDQFAFIRQVQIACDNAKGIVARLSGTVAPIHADTEKTIEELHARIYKTIDYVRSVPEAAFDGWENRHAEFPWVPGKYLTGFDYVSLYAIPNFYFHVTTAYAILRHNGVELGKADFLGQLPFKNTL